MKAPQAVTVRSSTPAAAIVKGSAGERPNRKLEIARVAMRVP